jgi:hypothetical protein
MGRRKPHNIKIREDRLSQLDVTKLEVAIWLLARGRVEARTQRSQPTPPSTDEANASRIEGGESRASRPDTREAAL